MLQEWSGLGCQLQAGKDVFVAQLLRRQGHPLGKLREAPENQQTVSLTKMFEKFTLKLNTNQCVHTALADRGCVKKSFSSSPTLAARGRSMTI